jgi:hypothetical protein
MPKSNTDLFNDTLLHPSPYPAIEITASLLFYTTTGLKFVVIRIVCYIPNA